MKTRQKRARPETGDAQLDRYLSEIPNRQEVINVINFAFTKHEARHHTSRLVRAWRWLVARIAEARR